MKEYLNNIRPYFRDLVNDLKQSDKWKLQLTITNNFISAKDDDNEDPIMHSKSNNIEIISSDETD